MLKTSETRLRALCRSSDELRPLYRKLSDRGREKARKGMGNIYFSAVPGSVGLGPR